MSLKTFIRTLPPSHPNINRLPILSSLTLEPTQQERDKWYYESLFSLRV